MNINMLPSINACNVLGHAASWEKLLCANSAKKNIYAKIEVIFTIRIKVQKIKPNFRKWKEKQKGS